MLAKILGRYILWNVLVYIQYCTQLQRVEGVNIDDASKNIPISTLYTLLHMHMHGIHNCICILMYGSTVADKEPGLAKIITFLKKSWLFLFFYLNRLFLFKSNISINIL